MKREELKRRLSLYHDGGLSEEHRREMENLLLVDPELKREERRIRHLSGILQSIQLPPLSAGARARLHAKLDCRTENGLLVWAESLAFTAVLLFLIGTTLYVRTETSERNPNPELQYWEQVAVMREDAPAYSAEPKVQLAHWLVGGLSGENEYD